MSGRWRIVVDENAWSRERNLYIGVQQLRGALSLVGPLVLEEQPSGGAIPTDKPTLSETRYEADDGLGDVTGFLQAAMDEAWRIGLRPTGFADHTNELVAVRYHLEDMRRLALPEKAS
jgi:hypothetical protein